MDADQPREEQRSELLDIADLLRGPPSRQVRFSEALARGLPLQRMPWQDFQRLCARLVEATFEAQAFEYGTLPQAQGGIDIIAIGAASGKRIVAECKRVQKIKAGDIAAWGARFIEGTDLDRVERFILAVTDYVETNNKRVEEWAKFTERTEASGIACELWDYGRIENLLRRHPEQVRTFFGEAAAERFCVQISLAERWPNEFKPRHRSDGSDGNYVSLEDRFIRLELFVPAQHSPSVSAGLSFARHDLRGLSMSVDSWTIVSWMQWVANAAPGAEAPFLSRGVTGNQWMLQAPHARLLLEPAEVSALLWVLQEGWSAYIRAAQVLDQVWRAARFPRSDDDSFFCVQLYSVSAELWEACVGYIRKYDAGKGTSSLHIYDAVRGMLKVYVPQPRAGMKAGYHLIAPVSRDNRSSWGDNLMLHWSPLSLDRDESTSYCPQQAWDAEYSHDWIATTFQPAVQDYLPRAARRSVQDGSGMISRASLPFCGTGLRLLGRDELLKLAIALQTHFHAYRSETPIRLDHWRRALNATLRVLRKLKKPDEHYIRGNLQLHSASLEEGIFKLISQPRSAPSSFEMDLALRSFYAAVNDLTEISASELDWIAACLQPVWDRVREDRICWTYR